MTSRAYEIARDIADKDKSYKNITTDNRANEALMKENKNKYYKLTPWGLNGVIVPGEKVMEMLEDLLSDDDKIEVKAVMMSDDDYKKLPEFQGF